MKHWGIFPELENAIEKYGGVAPLAEKCGVHRVTIYNILCGRNHPSMKLMFRMARELGRPVELLFLKIK